ncbi:MAG: hypothetical protein JXR51_07785 [Bacteroidales bacterium]|nr:hypothetical protein [Bacteroidales bacterium]MBN2757060.1 hypothetical protein [Bacteroidales bacterium]
MKHIYIILVAILSFTACSKKDSVNNTVDDEIIIDDDTITKNLTIFFINDQHAQIDNFAKVKYIVDEERKSTNVIVACSGDMFSGNPIVDYYPEKGYPMIDLMNKRWF